MTYWVIPRSISFSENVGRQSYTFSSLSINYSNKQCTMILFVACLCWLLTQPLLLILAVPLGNDSFSGKPLSELGAFPDCTE